MALYVSKADLTHEGRANMGSILALGIPTKMTEIFEQYGEELRGEEGPCTGQVIMNPVGRVLSSI